MGASKTYVVRRIHDKKYAVSIKDVTFTSRFQGHVEWTEDINSASLFDEWWADKVSIVSARDPIRSARCTVLEAERRITTSFSRPGQY